MNTLHSETKTIRLDSGVANLGNTPQIIEMCAGIGWVSHDDRDIVIYPGQTVELSATKHAILVSSPNKNQQLVFKVTQNVRTGEAKPVSTLTGLSPRMNLRKSLEV